MFKYVLFALPLYTWVQYFESLWQFVMVKRKFKEFHRKHNCVVMYAKNKCMVGWVLDPDDIIFSSPHTCLVPFEPLRYFLRTTEKSLDIAVMSITVRLVWKLLHELLEKGVQIRVLVDFGKMWNCPATKKLRKAGAQVKFYVNQMPDGDSIMHHKFAVKDFSDDGGFLTFGSLNWTDKAFTENYEDLVFTSDREIVKDFHKNFLEIWDFIDKTELPEPIRAITQMDH